MSSNTFNNHLIATVLILVCIRAAFVGAELFSRLKLHSAPILSLVITIYGKLISLVTGFHSNFPAWILFLKPQMDVLLSYFYNGRAVSQ